MRPDPLAVLRLTPDDTGEIFSPDHNRPVKLNATGAVIWQVLAGRGGEADCIAELSRHFPRLPEEKIRTDVRQFIQLLKLKGLLLE